MPASKAGLKRRVDGLGERIVAMRRERGLSQQVLATRAGISIPRLGDAERYGAATTETLGRIARALKVDVDTLTGRASEVGDAIRVGGPEGADHG